MKQILLIGLYLLAGFDIVFASQEHTNRQIQIPEAPFIQSQPTIEEQLLHQRLWQVYQAILHEDAQAQAASALHAEPSHSASQSHLSIPDSIPETDSLQRARELIQLDSPCAESAHSRLDETHRQSPSSLDFEVISQSISEFTLEKNATSAQSARNLSVIALTSAVISGFTL